MSSKLSILNIPPGLHINDFRSLFMELSGFKNAYYIHDYRSQVVGAIVEFSSFEFADYARKILQGYTFPGTGTNIVIDFYNDEQHPSMMFKPHHMQPSMMPPMDEKFQMMQGIPMQARQYMQSAPNGPPMMSYAPMAPQHQQQLPPSQMDPNLLNVFLQMAAQNQSLQQAGAGGLPKELTKQVFQVPSEATNCLYIEGIPIDAKEREVARIVYIFRPYPGYICSRLIHKEAENGRRFYYCFVDFENPIQSTICLQTLQGYRFHYKDKKGLKISYAPPTSLIRKRKKRGKSQK